MPPMISVSMQTSEIVAAFDREVSSRLAPHGFRKSPAGHFSRLLTADAHGHFGYALYTDRRTGQAQAWPVAGVRFNGVERLLCELAEEPFEEHGSFTIGKPIGFFMRRWDMAEWPVTSLDDAAPVAKAVVTALLTYGVPYMESHCTLEAAVQEMSPEQHGGSHDGPKLAVTYYLLGEHEKSLQVLDFQLERLSRGGYPDAERFYTLAANLRERIGAAGR